MNDEDLQIEHHPLKPFLPSNSQILMLGSFPPPHKRWSMEFFYPNIQNDMWRIYGIVFFQDKEYFYDSVNKKFRQNQIEEFLTQKGIAVFDTAISVRRLMGNASDQFLEIVKPTSIPELLSRIPSCRAIVATGSKAAQEICEQIHTKMPKVGGFEWVDSLGIRLYRMPSSSRSYPLALLKKADAYANMFIQENLLEETIH